MKILFIYSEVVVEIVGNKYHHNFLSDIINRYIKFGDLTVITSAIEVQSSNHQIINCPNNIQFRFINKENTLSSRFFNRTTNKSIIEEEITKTDFIIIHVPCSVQDLTAQYARKHNKPYLALVVGCPWDSLWNHSWKGRLLAPLSYFSLRRFMLKTSWAMYVTNTFLQSRYPSHGKTIGCSDVSLPKTDESIINDRLSRLNNDATVPSLASIGALIRVKGHSDVIRALSILKKKGQLFTYHLIGGGDNNALKLLSMKYDVANQVKFHGTLPHNEIFMILKNISIYIQPSKTEGISRALVEAMSMGCPAIATNVGGNPELIEEKWLYKPKDIDTLATKISILFQKGNLLHAAEKNYNTALNYQRDILDKRRDEFIDQAIKNYF